MENNPLNTQAESCAPRESPTETLNRILEQKAKLHEEAAARFRTFKDMLPRTITREQFVATLEMIQRMPG